MGIVRRLLKIIIVVGIGVGLLALAAVSPYVQTWVARAVLPRMLHGQVEVSSFWASFGRVQIAGFVWQRDGVILRVPEFEAEMPLLDFLRRRRLHLERVVSHGWSVTLRAPGAPAPGRAEAGAGAEPATPVASTTSRPEISSNVPPVWEKFLHTGQLPGEFYLGAVDLDGTIEYTIQPDVAASHAHVIVQAEGPGALNVDLSGVISNRGAQPLGFSTKGLLQLKLSAPQQLSEAVYTSTIVTGGRWATESDPLHGEIAFSPRATTGRARVDIQRRGRRLLQVAFDHPAGGWTGHWDVDSQPGDVSRYFPEQFLPGIAARGTGIFKFSEDFTSGALEGGLQLQLTHLDALAPDLRDVPTLAAETDFHVDFTPTSIHSNRLTVKLSTDAPVASFALEGDAAYNRATHVFSEGRPGSGAELELAALPLAWLRSTLHGLTLAGNASGKWRLGFVGARAWIQNVEPLKAEKVTASYSGHVVAEDLGLRANVSAQATQLGWAVAMAEAVYSSHEGPQLRFTLAGTPPVTPKEIYKLHFDGQWLAPMPNPSITSTANSESSRKESRFDVDLELPRQGKWAGKFHGVGSGGDLAVAGDIELTVDNSDYINFDLPLKISVRGRESSLEFAGKIYPGNYSDGLRLSIKGGSVYSEDLAIPLQTWRNWTESSPAANSRDTLPFWGGWRGNVDFSCDELHLPRSIVSKLHADMVLDHTAVRLGTALYTMEDRRLAQAHGDLAFNAAKTVPYELALDWSADSVDGEVFFGFKVDDENAPVHGKFTVATSLRSSGRDLKSIVEHARKSYVLESKHGIARLLRINLGDAVREKPTPVADAVGTVGNAFGRILGHGRGAADAGLVKLNARTEAILRFGNFVGELEFDQALLKVQEVSPTTLFFESISMSGPEMELNGSGQMDRIEDRPLRESSLNLTCHLAVKERLSQLLENAGVLEAQKDSQGYFAFKEPIHIGGTPRALDLRAWHDLLAAAINQGQVLAAPRK